MKQREREPLLTIIRRTRVEYEMIHNQHGTSGIARRRGGGGLDNVLYGGGLRPEGLPKCYPFHTPRANLHPFLQHTSKISQNNRISYNYHIFPELSVVLLLCASRCHFCQSLAPCHILRFSCHLSHLAADFVTLSYTKMTIFPTL